MKKIIKLLSIIVAIITIVTMAACSATDSAETSDSYNNFDGDTVNSRYGYYNDAVSSHTHSYGSWIVVTQASCSMNGEQQRSCSCGDVQTQPISAFGHSFKEATCTNPKICINCNEKSGTALGHTNDAICARCGVSNFTTLYYVGTTDDLSNEVVAKNINLPNGKYLITFYYGKSLSSSYGFASYWFKGGYTSSETTGFLKSKKVNFGETSTEYFNGPVYNGQISMTCYGGGRWSLKIEAVQ